MSSRNVFRFVVALSITLTMAGSVAAAFPGQLSEDWTTLLLWHGNDGLTDRLVENLPESNWTRALWLLVAFGLLAYATAVVLGLFLFWRFARFGFVCICALTLALVPFDGLVVMTPLEAALFHLSLVLDGVVVAMAYLPPVRYQFDQKDYSVMTTSETST
jgi:hypothetical protein